MVWANSDYAASGIVVPQHPIDASTRAFGSFETFLDELLPIVQIPSIISATTDTLTFEAIFDNVLKEYKNKNIRRHEHAYAAYTKDLVIESETDDVTRSDAGPYRQYFPAHLVRCWRGEFQVSMATLTLLRVCTNLTRRAACGSLNRWFTLGCCINSRL